MVAPLNEAQKIIDEYEKAKVPNPERFDAINWGVGILKRFGDYKLLGYTEAPDGVGRIVIGFPQLITGKNYSELAKVAESYGLNMEVKKEGAVILKDRDLPVAYMGFNIITILPPKKYEKSGKLLEDIGSIVGLSTERKSEMTPKI